jgi:hypothetical protein
VFVAIEAILNNTLLKLPNLVSNAPGPLSATEAIASRIPKPIIIARSMDTPLPFPINLP